MLEREVKVVRHATWCNVELDAGPCDCGGNEGRCPVCNALGPCSLVDGIPLICARPISLDSGEEAR